MEMLYVYSVFVRLRSKKLESLIKTSDICIYDDITIQFQSESIERVKEYFDSVQSIPVDDKHWRTISKTVIKTPLDTETEDGFYNEETIYSEYY